MIGIDYYVENAEAVLARAQEHVSSTCPTCHGDTSKCSDNPYAEGTRLAIRLLYLAEQVLTCERWLQEAAADLEQQKQELRHK